MAIGATQRRLHHVSTPNLAFIFIFDISLYRISPCNVCLWSCTAGINALRTNCTELWTTSQKRNTSELAILGEVQVVRSCTVPGEDNYWIKMRILNQILQNIWRVISFRLAHLDLCLTAYRRRGSSTTISGHPSVEQITRPQTTRKNNWKRLYLFGADMDRLLLAPLHCSGRRSATPELTCSMFKLILPGAVKCRQSSCASSWFCDPSSKLY